MHSNVGDVRHDRFQERLKTLELTVPINVHLVMVNPTCFPGGHRFGALLIVCSLNFAYPPIGCSRCFG